MRRIEALALLLLASSCRTTGSGPASIAGDEGFHERVESLLGAYERDFDAALERAVEKYDSNGRLAKDSPFGDAKLSDVFMHKDRARVLGVLCAHEADPNVCLDAKDRRSRIRGKTEASAVVDLDPGSLLTRLAAMEPYQRAVLPESPWSGSCWPLATGGLAMRYGAKDRPAGGDWLTHRRFVESKPARALLASKAKGAVDTLSPAEKIDLLIGDTDGTFAQAQWEEGRLHHDAEGRVDPSLGLCQGWAAASFMLPRPVRSVTLAAVDGRAVTLYPADIKALGASLWSKARYTPRYVGGDCRETGSCFDFSPALWHQAIVNQLGLARRSLIFDVNDDPELWNQPIYAYRYGYFHPGTLEPASTLQEAAARLPLAGDRFGGRRQKEARSVVGIAMEVTYVVPSSPDTSPTDSPTKDVLRSVVYLYDLELDSSGKIVGGAWYTKRHPDLLWTPEPDQKLYTWGDRFARGEWRGDGPLPWSWRKGVEYDARRGVALGKFVYTLFDLASGQSPITQAALSN